MLPAAPLQSKSLARRLSGLLVLVALVGFTATAGLAQTFDIVQERNGLVNVFARMKAGRPTTIAYFGGSITAGAGSSDSNTKSWRALTTEWFRRQYPKTVITEVNAAIGGTGSDFGAFRLQQDVLEKKPDLVFVEFAVNDTGTSTDTVDRAIEGIVRHIRTADPTTEICFVYTLLQSMLPDLKQGKLPVSMFHHDVVAAHYHVAAINVGAAAADQINTAKLAWSDFSKDNCHPTDAGYALYTDVITTFLAQQSLHISRQPLPYRLIEPLRKDAWTNGQMALVTAHTPPPSGWHVEHAPPGRGWPDLVSASDPSAVPLEFKFTGDTIGVCFITGPDTGNLDYKIDAANWQPLRPFNSFAAQGPLLASRILSDNLQPGPHTIQLRPRADKDENSKGMVTRIAYFMTNEPPHP